MFGRIGKALVGEPLHEPIDDAAFPGLLVRTGAPYVVEGPSGRRVELHEHEKRILVGETEGTLRPPKGVGRRSADNAWATVDGHVIKLKHRRARAARLLLDGVTVADLRAPRRFRAGRPNDRSRYAIEWTTSVDPRVAGVGHALALRYGVGAPGAGRRFLETFADAIST